MNLEILAAYNIGSKVYALWNRSIEEGVVTSISITLREDKSKELVYQVRPCISNTLNSPTNNQEGYSTKSFFANEEELFTSVEDLVESLTSKFTKHTPSPSPISNAPLDFKTISDRLTKHRELLIQQEKKQRNTPSENKAPRRPKTLLEQVFGKRSMKPTQEKNEEKEALEPL